MKNLHGTLVLPLILRVYNSVSMKWYINELFSVHNDMNIHTGAVMKMVQVSVHAQLTKHKYNTRISTESELVGLYY